MLTVRCARSGAQAEDVPLDAVPSLLGGADVTLWFDADSPTEAELKFLEKELKLHHLTLEDIVKQNQRPKIEPFEGYVYLAIHALIKKNRMKSCDYQNRKNKQNHIGITTTLVASDGMTAQNLCMWRDVITAR